MNSKEIVAYKCSNCGKAYLEKSFADECCEPKLCEDCGVEIPRSHPYIVCDKCRNEREAKQELERYNKATKYTFESVPKESIEMLYSELYPYNEGFMTDIDEDDVEQYGIKYVYGTKRIIPSLDAQYVVESMLEESFDDATEYVNEEELNKLQLAMNMFIVNHNGALDSYDIDYGVVIDL